MDDFAVRPVRRARALGDEGGVGDRSSVLPRPPAKWLISFSREPGEQADPRAAALMHLHPGDGAGTVMVEVTRLSHP